MPDIMQDPTMEEILDVDIMPMPSGICGGGDGYHPTEEDRSEIEQEPKEDIAEELPF